MTKYLIVAAMLALAACDKPDDAYVPPPTDAESDERVLREALKAENVEITVATPELRYVQRDGKPVLEQRFEVTRRGLVPHQRGGFNTMDEWREVVQEPKLRRVTEEQSGYMGTATVPGPLSSGGGTRLYDSSCAWVQSPVGMALVCPEAEVYHGDRIELCSP